MNKFKMMPLLCCLLICSGIYASSNLNIPVRQIQCKSHTILVAVTEVSQSLYFMVMKENPSLHLGDNFPVESVSWHDAVQFCNRLSQLTGLEPVYGADEKADRQRNGWRLPSPEEWQVIAGQAILVAHTGWYAGNSEGKTHSIGTKEPNANGLYDVFGNVWEWSDNGEPEMLQLDWGGGYRSNANFLSPDAHGTMGAGSWGDDLGIRIVRTVTTSY